MFDGINADAGVIRQHYQLGNLVCFYAAGNSFIWTDAEKAMFPASSLVSITLTANYINADVLDVETGGATAAQTHDWIAAKRAKGYVRPTIYCNLSNVAAVRTETREFILGRDYDIWLADWDDNTIPIYPLAVAKQYHNAGLYDMSVVYDGLWPRRTPAIPPPPAFKTAVSPQQTFTNVPEMADHLVMNAYAIVNGLRVPLTTWRVPC